MTDIRQVLSQERTRTIAGAGVVAALVAVIIQQSWSGLPVTGSSILGFLITGVALGSIYGVAAQGLVVTYATSGVFNFAQGAIGMFLAFVYWEFRVDIGLPTIVGILLTVLVAAPLMGVLIERLIMRFLTDSSIVAQLVVTIGLMLGLMGLAASVWNPSTPHTIPTFFGSSGFNIGSTFLPYYRIVTIATGIAIGLLLRFLLYHTRLGITMRAVVDNRDLTILNGARPASATMMAWALGSSMAALAGIFLSEELSALDPSTLTLFIVDAFAAAIIARLRSLPMAYVGGLIIGLTLSFQENFLSWTGRWTSAPQAIPAAILFIAVLFVRDARIKGRSKPRQTAERIPRAATDRPAVELREISVRFGGLQAVKNVSLDLRDGQIIGLIGPNGAGKTTLFNVATGMQEPNQGRIFVDGRDVTGARPHQFARLGLARTFQRLEVFGSLTVRDNIRVAAELHRRRWARTGGGRPDVITETIIEHLGLRAVASTRAELLSTGTARLVEVARALATQPRVLLLDEPSSGLSASETDTFAALLRGIAASGIAILVVEHDMGFIMNLCHHIVVLDAGEVIAVGTPVEVQADPRVLEAYLGTGAGEAERTAAAGTAPPAAARPVALVTEPAGPQPESDAPAAVQLDGVSAGYGGIDVLHDISLTVRPGEVCAVLGPNGAGKSTALKVMSGQLVPSKGTASVNGRSIAGVATERLVRGGLCVVPEGRGIFPNLTVTENLKMASFAGTSYAEILEKSFQVFPRLAERRNQLAGKLSGGEQQMVSMARALAVNPSILLVDELSMGLAPKVVEELYEVLASIARQGLTILVVEQFAAEVLKVADSGALLINGRITYHGAPDVLGDMISSAYLGGEHPAPAPERVREASGPISAN